MRWCGPPVHPYARGARHPVTSMDQTGAVQDYTLIITAIFAGFAAVELALGRFLNRAESAPKDVIIELSAGLTIPLLIVPGVLYASPLIVEAIAPNSADVWVAWPVWSMALVLVVADDLTQYWWHRLSHTTILPREHAQTQGKQTRPPSSSKGKGREGKQPMPYIFSPNSRSTALSGCYAAKATRSPALHSGHPTSQSSQGNQPFQNRRPYGAKNGHHQGIRRF